MPRQRPPQPLASAMPEPTFRSAAVARMAGMPVATLRVWEQRYGAIQPATAASGHRLYSAADVHRVMLLRQLTAQGHAIGSLAPLALAQLEQVGQLASRRPPSAGARAGARAGTTSVPPAKATTAPWRVVVVGPALAMRLQSPALLRQLTGSLRVVAVFDSLANAAAASGLQADVLMWHVPHLPADGSSELMKAQRQFHAQQAAVVYRFAAASDTHQLVVQGAHVWREAADDEALASWLVGLGSTLRQGLRQGKRRGLPSSPRRGAARPEAHLAGVNPHSHRLTAAAPRRFDDATLTAMASLPATLACECPRHIAELLMQLSSFEAYSAACTNRSPDDAQLHAYLHQVAGHSRALFEAALERVARAEGLALR